MSSTTDAAAVDRPGESVRPTSAVKSHNRRRIVLGVILLAVIVAMALSVKVFPNDSTVLQGAQDFDAKTYGPKQFPIQQKYIASKAVDAATLAKALQTSPTSAGAKYGRKLDLGYVIPVKFTGVAGKADNTGLPTVKVDGVPAGTVIHVQVGPAINGTDLRDVSGTVTFARFTNQIDFQDAGASINDEMKKKVLAKIDRAALAGKTVTVTGAFTEINPKSWNVTPATMEVK